MSLPTGFTVEINFVGPESDVLILDDVTRGLFDTGTFGGSDLSWVDVTPYVRSGSITRGVSRFEGVYGRAEAGRAEVVLDNADARFDPSNLAGPYVAAGATQVLPMVAWRIRCYGLDLWRGFADAWTLDYPLFNHDAVCTLTGTDGTKVLAQFNGAEQAPQGAGELPGARIARILDNADWPAEERDLDAGLTTLAATTLAAAAWTDVALTSDTELGEVYFTPAGKLRFRGRDALSTETRSSTVQATFSDTGADLPFQTIEIATDDTQLANEVRIGGPGFTPEQVADDLTSQLRFLKRSFVRSDLLMQTTTVANDYAHAVLGLLLDPELRIDAITLTPWRDPDTLFPAVLGRELGDRVAVEFTPLGRTGNPIERECFVRGIEHTFAAQTWVSRLVLQDASRLVFLVFDHPVLGVLDANKLGF